MRQNLRFLCLVSLLVAACAGDPPKPLPGDNRDQPKRAIPGEALLKYDTNKDGNVTSAEFTAGLRADYDTADTNHDGTIDLAEMRAVNAERWSKGGSAASPLLDWNQDGHIEFQEFASGPRSLFAQLDRDGDGMLSAEEINPRPRPQRQRRAPIVPFGPTPGLFRLSLTGGGGAP